MKLVLVESPYAGDIKRNVAYGRACLKDCFERGEAPFASHLLYTQDGVLEDDNYDHRELGNAAGFCWGKKADLTVVYYDYGITPGMKQGIIDALDNNRPIEYRTLMNTPETKEIELLKDSIKIYRLHHLPEKL